jgi:hypothetical protein
MPESDKKCEGCPETPEAGPSKLVVLLVWCYPQNQRAVGCQGGEVCRRRHLEQSSVGYQGQYEPGEYKY